MLWGRSGELARIEQLLDTVRRGRADAVAVHGEAGIGKTAILEYALERSADLRVLRTRGIESEVELPNSALLDVLRPVLESVDAVVEPQAAALRAALRLAASERPPDRLAVYAGTLSTLAAAAEQSPLLILVDDLQWIDTSSRDALLFAARRLRDDPIATLVATRGDEVSTDGLETIQLAPLDDLAARKVVGAAALASKVEARVLAAAAGNPLALVELPRALTPEQRSGTAALPEPILGGDAAVRLFGRRLSGLDKDARLALVTVAASTSEDVLGVSRAATRLGVDVNRALAALEDAGLVEVRGGRVLFRHPLVRSAAYAGASAGELRSCHQALADASDVEQLADVRAWHRALAAVEPDESVAAELEQTALRSAGRSGHASARAFEHAARLTPDLARRGLRFAAAAEALRAAGEAQAAAAAARQALEFASDPVARARAERVLGWIETQRNPRRAAVGLARAASEVEAADPELAALLLFDALDPLLQVGELAELKRLVEHAWQLPWARGGDTEVRLAIRYGDALAVAGDVARARELWLHAALAADAPEPETRLRAGEALFSIGANDRARAVIEPAIEELRHGGRIGSLVADLGMLTVLEARSGDLAGAQASAAEVLELARAVDDPLEQAHASGQAAWVAAMRGAASDCRQYADEARRLAHGRNALAAIGDHAEGLLELGEGRAADAVDPLLRAADVRGVGDSLAPRPMVATLIEALTRTERREQADAWLSRFEREAAESGRGEALAEAARCRGLLADDAQGDGFFADAIWYHALEPNPFETARTQLCYGERLRRRRQKRQAGEQLRAALATFERIGAVSWADRAARELTTAGDAPRRPSGAIHEGELTAQELNVARLVVEGLTNREIAARLFLSPKTIETHLMHVFRKRGVRSRTELALKLTSASSGFLPIEPARTAL